MKTLSKPRTFSLSPTHARKLPRRGHGGFTLVETSVASTLLIMFLTSMFALNSTVMRMLRLAGETVSASQEAQARIEQVRFANWQQVSNANWVRDVLLTQMRTDAVVYNDLPGMSERIEGWREGATAPAYVITRSPEGTVTSPVTADLSAEDLVYVHVVVNWTSWGGRARSREVITVVSHWGISK